MWGSKASTSLARRLETASRKGSIGSMICFQEEVDSGYKGEVPGAVATLESAANMCVKLKVPSYLSQTSYPGRRGAGRKLQGFAGIDICDSPKMVIFSSWPSHRILL